jgi:SAM-dependent methyltransferase
MSIDSGDLAPTLAEIARRARLAADGFLHEHGEELEVYRKEVASAVHLIADRLRRDVSEISGSNRLCNAVAEHICEYVDWLQWSFWDLPYFAIPIGIPPERFRERLAACGQVYLAGRVFDDVIDRHFCYKGKRETMFSISVDNHASPDDAYNLTMLSGLLLCAQGLKHLSSLPGDDRDLMLSRMLDSFRRAVVGAILEHAEREDWNEEYYERLIHLKNVDFWRCLYTAIDPRRESPLYPFLERYYALAQKLNDLSDFPEDERRGQPNLLSVHVRNGSGRVEAQVGHELSQMLIELARRADTLPPLERSVALLKLGETLRDGFEISGDPAAAPPHLATPDATSLHWYASLAEIVDRFGVDALEQVCCAVCGGAQRRFLFELRGFGYYQCEECSQTYVTPRVRSGVLIEMGNQLEELDDTNDFLEIQRIFAEPICHLIRLRAPGPRLLDLGFGRGHVIRLAQAYGFEVYGMDGSGRLVRNLEPEFGHRVYRGMAGIDAIPWNAFDAVVMSHIVEHLPDPRKVLAEVMEKLAPGGVLYIAVPDMDSLQFRIFGKHWDVISPLVHMQYFNEQSLSRLLGDCGFDNLERIRYPSLPKELTPKWMQLFRKLGGDEAGELAMVAQRPSAAGPVRAANS